MSPARKFWIAILLLTGNWPLALIVYATRPKNPMPTPGRTTQLPDGSQHGDLK